MAGGYLNGTVTFAANGDRNRARNAITQYVGTWNAANPTMPLTGTATDFQYQYPADDEDFPGVSSRALAVSYTSPDYAAIEAAQNAIAANINANAVRQIVSLGTGRIL